MSKVTVVQHPLVQHKLTRARRKETSSAEFRRLVNEIAMLLAYEVTRDLPLTEAPIETPLETMRAPVLAGRGICIVSILRAGNGLLDGLLELMPEARVGHIGLYRDPQTLEPVEYYYKMPPDLAERPVLLVDPMLATANSAVAAASRLRKDGVRDLKLVCLLAAPEGIARFGDAHPDVAVFTAAIDRCLNEHAYILPGLGDAGDRIYGTR